MPTRRLPRTAAERDAAMRNGKTRKDTIPVPLVIPYSAATILRLDNFYPIYRTKFLAVANLKTVQSALTAAIELAKKKAIMYELDFLDALNKAIRREEFLPSVRGHYTLDVSSAVLPRIVTESEVTTWGQNINDGETARIAAGGAAITFPSLAQVTAAVNSFISLNQQQENAKTAYDLAQEDLEAQNPEADKLILRMWNETEATFDEGDKPSMRRKSRQWGAVYIPIPGEAPSPDDFSIIGKVTDSLTGAALGEVGLVLMPPDELILSESNGNFYYGVQPAGTYSIHVHRGGYADKDIPGIIVTAGAITTVNIQLTPVGTVGGTVTQGGMPAAATITITGIPGSITTDPMGNFNWPDVPAGNVTVHAALISNPAIVQSITVTLPAAGIVAANFSFP